MPALEPLPSFAASSLQRPDIVLDVDAADERLWMSRTPTVAARFLMFDLTHGQWVMAMRTTGAGVVTRHRHPSPVHGYVIRGRWRYLEHDWVADAGRYIFEPPGETHTLVVDEGAGPSLTIFWMTGPMLYVDEDGAVTGYDDVFTRLEAYQEHLDAVGLGRDHAQELIR